MNNRCVQNAMACIGAVIGAGFASGREILTFFTKHGQHSWWLIILTAAASSAFCAIIMRASANRAERGWYALHDECCASLRIGARICVIIPVVAVSGAMLAAAGHMVSLLWANEWAYAAGIVGTLIAAWRLGFGSLRPLSIISWVLTGAIVLALLVLMKAYSSMENAVIPMREASSGILSATIKAVAYAGMNVTLAVGVVCGCGSCSQRDMCRSSAIFGFMLLILLFVSNMLYLMCSMPYDVEFPIVMLLGAFGRAGYIIGAVLLYLALFTTLIALMRALKSVMDRWISSKGINKLVTLALPLGMSFVGFSRIVDAFYAPIGCLCILLVILPLAVDKKEKGTKALT